MTNQLSLCDVIRASARAYPNHAAIYDGQQTLRFDAFDALTDRLAAGLSARGVAKGDRIALYCPNSAEFALAYVGIIKAGAVVVPINLLLNPREMDYILQDAEVCGLLYHADFAEVVEQLSNRPENRELNIPIGPTGSPDSLAWQALLSAADPIPEIAIDPLNDLVVIIYTSGTTGYPKGAMLTHDNLVANTESVRLSMAWRPGHDIVAVVLPMFHAFAGTVGMLTPLTCGCAFVPLPKFDPDGLAQAVRQLGVTIFLGVPSMFAVLLRIRDDKAAMFASLRFCVSGGAALPVDVLERFEAKFGKRIYEGDGPTECSPVTCVNPIDGVSKPGTVGLPVYGVEMRIVDETGRECRNGEVGEIAVRGRNVMKGYWRNPEATAETIRDAWLYTGDLGTRDDDGYFAIVDRKKDLIIVNGMNVYPRVIEEVLYRHPAVREAAVVGDPHPLHGELPIAYVGLQPDLPEGETPDLRTWCRKYLGRHEVPREVRIVSALPRNAAGKILKRELRRQGEIERGVDLRKPPPPSD